MRTRILKWLRRRLAARRGQSMVAYAVVSAFFLGSLTIMSIKIFPDMLNAIDQFASSMYMGINLPFP